MTRTNANTPENAQCGHEAENYQTLDRPSCSLANPKPVAVGPGGLAFEDFNGAPLLLKVRRGVLCARGCWENLQSVVFRSWWAQSKRK